MSDTLTSVRADKWLWAARFFKTRSLAIEAIKGGKLQVNGERVKPAHKISPGDRLTIRKGESVYEVTVAAVSLQRRPAVEAQTLYEESDASCERRRQQHEQQRLLGRSTARPVPRPDKRGRRQIHRFKSDIDGA